MAISIRIRANPLVGLRFLSQVRNVGVCLVVTKFGKIRILDVFPAVLELFEHTTTTLGETGITNLAIVHHHLTASGGDGLLHDFSRCTGNALITLTMVVCADIETGVVLTVVPTDQFVLRLSKRRIFRLRFRQFLVLLNLCQQPSTGNYGMRLEQFQRSGCTHFRRNDTREIIFHVDDIDTSQLFIFHDNLQSTDETLVFLSFPVEVDTDSYILQFESIGCFIHRFEQQLIVEITIPMDSSILISHCLQTTHFFLSEPIGIQQDEVYLRFKHDSYMYFRFFHDDTGLKLFLNTFPQLFEIGSA